MSNLCIECGINNRWFDVGKQQLSMYCSRTCLNTSHQPKITSNLCIKCQTNNKWFDHNTQQFSNYCSTTCRDSDHPKIAYQGQPMCRICRAPAFYDGQKFSPGCGKRHAQEAMARGFMTPI
ncbi:hypothetical protein [Powai lake megavirus]|uniref:Uncharacterized protein n=1 Tax=Powai lake megavirus TaxID=1842663 RepID=A0A167R191_9VIRU|nr:hypothetical protein QJ849_gp031 [Powai lake megavirus]ANB50193.1 hypothetical protein [Powai lake megavirus]